MTATSWTTAWMATCSYGKVGRRLNTVHHVFRKFRFFIYLFIFWFHVQVTSVFSFSPISWGYNSSVENLGLVIKHFGTRCYKKIVNHTVVCSRYCYSPEADYFPITACIPLILQQFADSYSLDWLMNVMLFSFIVCYVFCSQVRTLTRRSARWPWRWLRTLLKRRTTPVKHRYTASMCQNIPQNRTSDLYIFLILIFCWRRSFYIFSPLPRFLFPFDLFKKHSRLKRRRRTSLF